VRVTAGERDAADGLRRILAYAQKIITEGSLPGISNRLSPEDKWLPQDDDLQTSDREFLHRWLKDYAGDSAWDKMVGAARRFRPSRTFDHTRLIWYALRALRAALDSSSGVDPLHAERQARHDELLELAKRADVLTEFWQRAEAKSAVLAPFSPPFPVPFDRVLQFQELNKKQARFLREMAGARPPAPPISRQGHSKTRERTRESRVFMRTMVGFMRETCGKPHNDVVAMLATIAFPGADFTTDNVRAAIQPSTRSARRRKNDALGPEESD
jgi:hypothetical protein